jgi:predicted MPP superfamily phosphohydrolase
VEQGITKMLELEPDLVFFTGDLVNNKADEMDGWTEVFSKIKAPMGVYSILGNHDYGDYHPWPDQAAKEANFERLKSVHQTLGWNLLMNEHRIIERDGASFALIGVENWGAKANFSRYGDLKKAYAGSEPHPFKILLSHDPSHWDAQVCKEYNDIDLMLSGHTHGMQFGVEIPGIRWSPVQYVYKQWAGLYQNGHQHLYVNRGFGFLGYPGRVGILPEITFIEFS